ncbi:MAG: prepilin-type N-terminal cleavage/methylation domain-containing protein [Vampirovibrionales bacterium]|nr:prepilin-type N-terminal cleavage/methylation domain-containing protein [Vampirovibrionales bacterium]
MTALKIAAKYSQASISTLRASYLSAPKGFTLAEILIALALLGAIAAFTIPKVLQSTGVSRASAVAKETASMVSAALGAYTLNNTLDPSDTFATLANAYLNYVKIVSDGSLTMTNGSATAVACNATNPCYVMHSGALVQYSTANTFGGTSGSNGIRLAIDPDGSLETEPFEAYLYANGRITTAGTGATAPTGGGSYTGTVAATDPSYISDWT